MLLTAADCPNTFDLANHVGGKIYKRCRFLGKELPA